MNYVLLFESLTISPVDSQTSNINGFEIFPRVPICASKIKQSAKKRYEQFHSFARALAALKQ